MERSGLVRIQLGDMHINLREEDVRSAHGIGLSGEPVHSLRHAPSVKEGYFYIFDKHGRALSATPDELYALLRQVAPEYEITAVKKI